MQKNYLLPYLKDFFNEVSYFNGNLYAVDSMLRSKAEQLENDFTGNQDLYSTITYYRDLSQLEGGSNLYDTGYGHDVSTLNLKQHSENAVSYVCCTTVSHVYEIFDSFLKNILASVYINSDSKESFKLKEQFENFEKVREGLWMLKREGSLLKVMRRISPFYAEHEKNNIWGYNVGVWFSMIDKVRHQIVHNRQKLTETFILDIEAREEGKLFKKNFSLLQQGSNWQIVITYPQASHILNTFIELAHLIFKSLSTDLNMDASYSHVESPKYQ